MNSIFHRISVRKYEDKPVEKEKIMEILKAGMQAPSACNQQPWEFYVVTDKEKIQKLSKVTPAPVFLPLQSLLRTIPDLCRCILP